MAATGQVLHQNRARVTRAWATGLVAAIVLGAGDARAAETRPIDDAIVLGSHRCLQRGALSRRLGTWLGADVVDARVSITIDEDTRAVRFVLRRDGAVAGERTIAVGDDTCDDVTAAVALAIASAIEVAAAADEPPIDDVPDPAADPSTPARDAADEPATAAPATPAAPTATTPPAPAPAPAPPPPAPLGAADEATSPAGPPGDASRRGTVAITVEGAALLGVFPRPAFAIAPAGSIAIGEHAELRLSAIGALPVVAELVPSGTAEVGLYAGRLDGCGGDHLLDGRAWIRGCGGLAVGGVPAEGLDVEDPSASVGAWVALAGRAELQWMPSSLPVGIALSVDGLVPVVRPRLEVQAAGASTATRDLPLLGVSAAAGPCVLF